MAGSDLTTYSSVADGDDATGPRRQDQENVFLHALKIYF
jgi:hypothetical protein